MKNKSLTEKVWNLIWSSSNHKWRRQQQWHLTKGFTCTLALIFWTFIRFFMQKKQECNNQKFKVLRIQIFSHVISNSKRARTKFKFIGKFKMLRNLKHQKAFPARSLSFFCAFIPFVRKATRKVMIKNSRIWDGTQSKEKSCCHCFSCGKSHNTACSPATGISELPRKPRERKNGICNFGGC